MEKQNYHGAERIFGWSFESGKFNDPAASADEFIAEALAFFGDSTFDRESPWANGERLADHVRKQRNLLVLDGLETLQSDRDVERGAIKDPALATLLTALAQENPGLCIITSRMRVADLACFCEHAILKDLEKLSPQADIIARFFFPNTLMGTLEHYLIDRFAKREDLIGDIDGVNLGAIYDPSLSAAANLRAYYGKQSQRRFQFFLANTKNEMEHQLYR